MKGLKLSFVQGLVALAVVVGVAGEAFAVNTFGVDLAAITTDLTTVGTLMVGLAVFFLGYKWVRRMLAR